MKLTYLKLITSALLLFSGFAKAQESSFVVNQDFKSLFNQYRFAQPSHVPWAGTYFPYSYNGTAAGLNGASMTKSNPETSAIAKYDELFNGGKYIATDFELKNHSCDVVPESEKASCEGWWGHCNGWAAAGIKEIEPRKTVSYKGVKLDVGQQKGILTELWLSTNSLFLGDTDKGKTTGDWVYDLNDPGYNAFWDVTPRQMFLVFTNQVGALKTGVVIDRFTGDQVWNQPIVGYRILPIAKSDLGTQSYNGKVYPFAQITMKIYWADDGVAPNHLSGPFNIAATSDDQGADNIGGEYTQRNLTFKMFFDKPLQMDASGTKVLNDVKIIGGGIWDAQENQMDSGSLDQSHPDFIWLPTSPYIANNGYANPYINWDKIKQLTAATIGTVTPPPPPPPVVNPPTPTPPPPPPVVNPPIDNTSATKYTVLVSNENVYDGQDEIIAERLIARIFRRANLEVDIDRSRIHFLPGKIEFILLSGNPVSKQDVMNALQDSGATVLSIK